MQVILIVSSEQLQLHILVALGFLPSLSRLSWVIHTAIHSPALDVDDVPGEHLLEVVVVESVDEGVDRWVGITNPENVEIELRRSREFLKIRARLE